MCRDPQHGAYKIRPVKWFIYAVVGLLLTFCPDCWSARLRRLA